MLQITEDLINDILSHLDYLNDFESKKLALQIRDTFFNKEETLEDDLLRSMGN